MRLSPDIEWWPREITPVDDAIRHAPPAPEPPEAPEGWVCPRCQLPHCECDELDARPQPVPGTCVILSRPPFAEDVP